MSCCSKGYCNFSFPEGPPIVDNSVTNLNAQYQFLPYGTLLEKGEVVRIWMESGKTATVILEDKIPLQVTEQGIALAPEYQNGSLDGNELPWQLIAFDSGFAYEDLMQWHKHPLFNPESKPVLMVYRHPIEVKPSLKMRLYQLLYKIRNL